MRILRKVVALQPSSWAPTKSHRSFFGKNASMKKKDWESYPFDTRVNLGEPHHLLG